MVAQDMVIECTLLNSTGDDEWVFSHGTPWQVSELLARKAAIAGN
ncbi:MAG: hypothetical protein RM338_03800 [Nostoc sp. DedQUE12a]|nr:hypothetical protein [Nostoc sp. DedQUE12a]